MHNLGVILHKLIDNVLRWITELAVMWGD